LAEGESFKLGVATPLKNNKFKFGQNKSVKLKTAYDNVNRAFSVVVDKTIYPDLPNFLQYNDQILLGPSSLSADKGERENVLISGVEVNTDHYIHFKYKNILNNGFQASDDITFYGTGLAGGWKVPTDPDILPQGIKNGPISRQEFNDYLIGTVDIVDGKYQITIIFNSHVNSGIIDYGFILDLINQNIGLFDYIITPINSSNNSVIGLLLNGSGDNHYYCLIGDYHIGGWRKGFAQRIRIKISYGMSSKRIIYQDLLSYNASTKFGEQSLLVPYQYYKIGGRVWIDTSQLGGIIEYGTSNNWTLNLRLIPNDNWRTSSEIISVPLATLNSQCNKWVEFSTVALLQSNISHNSSAKLEVWLQNDGLGSSGGGYYGDVILYLDELYIEHAGGVNYANTDGCLDFGRYLVWPEQGSLDVSRLSGKINFDRKDEKYRLKAKLNHVSQAFWDQLEILREWQQRGFLLNLHSYINDIPYVLTGKMNIRDFKKDSWHLDYRSFTFEFTEE